MWEAGEHIMLHSGCPLPQDGERAARNEDVGIVLDKAATEAWKNAGEVWEAVSSRIVMARLLSTKLVRRRHHRNRKMYVSVISAYAQTVKPPSGIKQKSYTELQDTLDS